jgi:hypothetical protein
MAVVAEYWPRNLSVLPQSTERLFEVEPGTRLLAKFHAADATAASNSGSGAACSFGHEVQIWRLAKLESVKPRCQGQVIRDDDIRVETEEGTLEIVEPAQRPAS